MPSESEKAKNYSLAELEVWIGDAMESGATPEDCLLYTSPSPRDRGCSRMPSSA